MSKLNLLLSTELNHSDSRQRGYTIFEVLIVLAVTVMLFAVAATLLGGRQSKTEATESVRALDSALQAISREVASGYYETNSNCSLSGSGPVNPNAAGSFAPGSNTGCIFLGKMLNVETTKATKINLIGRQFIDGSTTYDVTCIAEAQPVQANNTEELAYTFGLKITRIVDDVGNDYSAIGFLYELGGGISNVDNPVTGSRGIELYGIGPSSTVVGNSGGKISDASMGTIKPLPKGVIICVTTGNENRGKLTIGESGNQYSTYTTFYDGVDPACGP